MKTLEEIKEIRENKIKELDLRVNTASDTREKHIFSLPPWYRMYIIKIS